MHIPSERECTRRWHLSRGHPDQRYCCRQRYLPAQIGLLLLSPKQQQLAISRHALNAGRLFAWRGERCDGDCQRCSLACVGGQLEKPQKLANARFPLTERKRMTFVICICSYSSRAGRMTSAPSA